MDDKDKLSRQQFMGLVGRGVGLLALGGVAGSLISRRAKAGSVWQIDPGKCTQCEQCATQCVLDQSAVKAFHAFPMCGYCELCTGFFEPQPNALTEGAENQLCPTGALKRRFIEDPYFEYTIDETLCNGCGRCVKGCNQFGNGSLYLQVRRDACLNCNQCTIAAACPSDAFERIPESQQYHSRLGKKS